MMEMVEKWTWEGRQGVEEMRWWVVCVFVVISVIFKFKRGNKCYNNNLMEAGKRGKTIRSYAKISY